MALLDTKLSNSVIECQVYMYFDYAAATPIDKRVLMAMEPYFSDDFYNPSAAYSDARRVRADYQAAKHRLAQAIGAKPAEIIMTAGATESINLAINQSQVTRVKSQVLVTAIEHLAVLKAAQAVGAKILPVDESGRVNIEDIKKAITNDTILISVGYANNEIGTVQPIREIANLVSEIRANRFERGVKTPIYLHTDASQAAGHLDINVARLDVDMMTLNAGKCYGPKQVGCLYVRAGIELSPMVYGGGQEMGLRSGTENVVGTIGFATALEIAEKKRKSEAKRLEELRKDLEKFVISEIKEISINGHKKYRLPNILNFSVAGLDAERAVFALDQHGIQVATGSACAANKSARSHVLTAIGLDDKSADGSIRISMGRGTTKSQIEKLKPIIKKVIENERKLS